MFLKFRPLLAAFFMAFAGAVASASGPAFADGRAMILPVDKVELVAETPDSERKFTIEIADEAMEQQRGLMFRESMADNHGMLFVFGMTRESSFWMENTPMALDLVFIGDDGKVRAVLKGQPFSRASISPGVPVRFVLELKDGMAAANGIVPGVRLRHPAIDAIAGSN